jgi:hypothetical protein
MTAPADLKLLAAETIGEDVWPFVALDWYAHRVRQDSSYSRERHLRECVTQLRRGRAPWPWSLKALVAVSAELMGGDVAAIEAAVKQLIKDQPADELAALPPAVMEDLAAAGLTPSALGRLGFAAATAGGPTRTSGEAVVPRSPSVFISYSHELEPTTSPWNRSVKKFAELLRAHGIDAEFDQWDNHMDKDWSLWGPALIEQSDVVICLASPDFARKWGIARGSGVSAEARTIRAAWEQKRVSLLFVVLPGRSVADKPGELGAIHHEVVKRLDDKGIEGVLRELTRQPRSPKPPLGPIDDLPPDE